MSVPVKSPWKGRTAARIGAVQALYQLEIEPANPQTVIRQFREIRFMDPERYYLKNPDQNLFEEIVLAVTENKETYDNAIRAILAKGWTLQRLELVLIAILRAGFYELSQKPETPKAVIINEYVGLTKSFCNDRDINFINGALENLAKSLGR